MGYPKETSYKQEIISEINKLDERIFRYAKKNDDANLIANEIADDQHFISAPHLISLCWKSRWLEPLELAVGRKIQLEKTSELLRCKVSSGVDRKNLSDKTSMVRQIGNQGKNCTGAIPVARNPARSQTAMTITAGEHGVLTRES